MALSAKTNQLTGPAVTGNSATTDPGFQPKALMVFNGLQTAVGASAKAQFSLGVAGSTTTETSAGFNSDDNIAASDTVRFFNTSRLGVNFAAGTVTSNIVYDLTSFDATGFTSNWSTLTTTSPLYNYLALGGSDITNVFTGSYAMNTATGNQSVTGVGFQPDIVILFGTLQASSGQSNNTNQYGFGVMDAAGNQWAISQRAANSAATMDTNRSFSNVSCYILNQTGADNFAHKQSFVSMDADGFTVNIGTALGSASLVGYMAIKGGRWKVGTDAQKTSTGTKATTGVGFTPSGMIFGSVNDTTTNSVSTNARFTIGASTGSSNNTAIWTGDRDNVPDAIANTIMRADKCLVMATEGTSATPTVNAEAAMSTLDSDGFTLNWTTADATARLFGYVAFGSNGGTANTSTLTASISFAGAQTKRVGKAANASVGFTGAFMRATSRTLTAVQSFSGNLSKRLSRELAGVVGFLGNFSASHLFLKALTAGLSFAGAYSKVIAHRHSASVGFAGAQAKLTSRSYSAAVGFAGGFAKSIGRAFTAALSLTGNLARGAIHLLTLVGGVSFAASTTKSTRRSSAAGLGFTGGMGKATRRSLTASVGFTAAFAKSVARLFTGAVSFTGAIGKTSRRALVAAVGFIGALASSAGHTGSQYFQTLTASIGFSGTMGKRTGKVLAASVSWVGQLLQLVIPKFMRPSPGATISAVFSAPALRANFATVLVADFNSTPTVRAAFSSPQLTAGYTSPTIQGKFSNPSVQVRLT